MKATRSFETSWTNYRITGI